MLFEGDVKGVIRDTTGSTNRRLGRTLSEISLSVLPAVRA